MADPEDVAPIRAYIEQHSKTYNRESLRRNLIRDGHDPQAVDTALEQAYGSGAGVPTAQASRAGLYFFLAILAGVAIHAVLVFVVIMLVVNGPSDGWLWPIIGLPVLGELVAIVVLWRRNTRIARGLAWGLAVPLIVTALLFGACLAIIAQLNVQ